MRKFILSVFWSFLSFMFIVSFIVAVIYLYLISRLPDVSLLQNMSLQVPLRIYSADHQLIGQFGTKQRIPIVLSEVPRDLIHAVLATEDVRFYEHRGVDLIGIFRATRAVITEHQPSQGASTIPMQVARNFFLDRKKTIGRKINEIILALQIDKKLSKEKILELYLNKIYFGNHAYGIAAAAQVYYGKTLNQLDLPEIAMIAGLPQAPSRNNPLDNPKAALERRNHVLNRMREVGFITPAVCQEAIHAPITATYHVPKKELLASDVAEMVRKTLAEKYGPSVYEKGFVVHTTIRSELQNAANQALQNGLLDYSDRHAPGVQGALVALNPENGAILALVGGFSEEGQYFNRATQAERQPGSSFKPFIYSAALEKNYTLASVFNDAPIVIQDSGENEWWRPVNHTEQFYGPTSLRTALVESRNLVSIRLLRAIGIAYAIDYVTRFGFNAQALPQSLSLALGSGTATPLQMASAYAVFANGGMRIQPYFIERIEDQMHHVLYQADLKQAVPLRVISEQNAYLITDALRDVIQHGTAKAARILQRDDLAGKTGTTNNQLDAWFSGFNRYLCVTVWVGFDNLKSLKEYAATVALPIWIDFMQHVLPNIPDGRLSEPPGIVRTRIDPRTGLLALPDQPGAQFEIFQESQVPTQTTTFNKSSDEIQVEEPLF